MAISVFDLFKVGIGPSSSHTVGPMRAAATFVEALIDQRVLNDVRRVEIRLYGSLSATGVGHATDRATVMGLMGEWPDRIDPSTIDPRIQQLRETGRLSLAGQREIAFNWQTDLLLLDESLPYHPNAMSLTAFGETAELFAQTYYSVGGGFIIEAAEAESGVAPAGDVVLPYDFSSAAELLSLCRQHNLRVSELMMANERAWRSDDEIRQGLLHIWSVMR
ncbi:L-serine ammonia-lyase, partial [Pseudomonas sp. HMWF005]